MARKTFIKLIILLAFVFSFVFLTTTIITVKADEDIITTTTVEEPEDDTTTTIVIEDENIDFEASNEETEINTPSKAETLLEKYFGWFVGIPVGSIITILGLLLTLFGKIKDFAKMVKEWKEAKNDLELSTKDKVEKTEALVNSAKELLSASKELQSELKEHIDVVEKEIESITNRFNNTDKLIVETKETFDNLKTRLASLEQAQLLISAHTKELVGNGTAERVVKLIEDARNGKA